MSIGSRPILLILSFILLLFACLPEKKPLEFTFPNHSIKLYYDPLTHDLTAVDTISVHYDKNVDRLYFFLHKALHVEQVSVGHQTFKIGEMNNAKVDLVGRHINEMYKPLVDQAQIVVVQIPKSLYSERIEIRYKGKIDLTSTDATVWHPMLPDTDSTFHLTTIIPRDFYVIIQGEKLNEQEDDLWRLNRFAINDVHTCCPIQIVQKAI